MSSPSDLYCVMGNPVAHSRSPWIHARFAQLTQQSLHYERRLLPLAGFASHLQTFIQAGGKGCNVTVPFKQEAAQAAHSRSNRVALANAANTLVIRADGSIHAENTDGLGLLADITDNAGYAIANKDLLLLGAGGAAAGVLGPLLEQAPHRIVVCNRSFDKAQALVQQHAALAMQHNVALVALEQQAVEEDFDLVINATAASLQGAGVPVPGRVLRPGSLAYDMMYGSAALPFLAWAHQHGAVGRDGLGMLVEQAAASFALWRGVRPPSQQVLQELRAVIAQETPA